jgi:hypothetical protein
VAAASAAILDIGGVMKILLILLGMGLVCVIAGLVLLLAG